MTDFDVEDLLTALSAANDPAEKAAIMAESIFSDLPEEIALVARRCIILHWFNRQIIENFLPEHKHGILEKVYTQFAALPFIESLPLGLAYHDLTREGLLKRYAASQPEVLIAAAKIAAPIYEAQGEDKKFGAEAFFCRLVAGEVALAIDWIHKLTNRVDVGENWQILITLCQMEHEAEALSFVQPLPRDTAYWARRAFAERELKHYDKVVEACSHAFALQPSNSLILLLLHLRGEAYGQIGSYDAALADFSRALELNPPNAAISMLLRYRGATYYQLKQYEAALADFSRALDLNPDDTLTPLLLMDRGRASYALKQHEAALVDFSRALDLNRDDAHIPALLLFRGQTYYLLDQYEEALADFSHTLDLNSSTATMPELLDRRGEMYYQLGQYQAALADFSRTLALNPDAALVPLLLFERGMTYRQLGQHEAALADFSHALVLNPHHDRIFYERALVYQVLGFKGEVQTNLRSAVEQARQTYEENPQDWDNTFNLALYSLAAGACEEAEHLYQEALSRGAPTHSLFEAMRNLDALRTVVPDQLHTQSIRERLQAAIRPTQ